MISTSQSDIKTQLSHLIFILIITVGSILIFLYINYESGFIGALPLFVGLFLYLIYFVPVLFLHIEYLSIDRNTVVIFNKEEENYRYTSNKTDLIFNANEIKSITLYADKIGWFSTSSYYFYLIKLENSNIQLVITSFITKNFAIPEKQAEKIVKRNRLIASPFLEKLDNSFEKL